MDLYTRQNLNLPILVLSRVIASTARFQTVYGTQKQKAAPNRQMGEIQISLILHYSAKILAAIHLGLVSIGLIKVILIC
jgi:hypothetical protein